MTLDEAITKLKNTPVDVVVGDALTFALAKRLGIEALEKILLLRRMELNGQRVEPYTRLPSETQGVS